MDDYIHSLCGEIYAGLKEFNLSFVPTVYIGGGTPSLLGARRISRLFEFLCSVLPNRPLEFSVEANPESLDAGFIAACEAAGATRLSIGIQSFNEKSRAAIGRKGSTKLLAEKLRLLKSFALDISFDLLAGVPFQSKPVLLNDIERALEFMPAHISLYDLTLEEGTPLFERVRRGGIALRREEEAEECWIAGRDALESAGYEQYEVSNFAREGKRSLHNIRYWLMLNWLGAGSSASSTIICDSTGTGIRRVWGQEEALSRATLIKESIMMGFRFIDGPDAPLFEKRFGRKIDTLIPKTISRWRERGLVSAKKLALTKEGLLFQSGFTRDAFRELENII